MDHEGSTASATRSNVPPETWLLNLAAKRLFPVQPFNLIPSLKQLLKDAVKTRIWPQHHATAVASATVVKGTEQLLQIALRYLAESQNAKLCALMFCVHKTNPSQWLEIREVLLRHAVNHRQLSVLGTALECSTKDELSACYPYFPGLKGLERHSHY